ncbi:hypothetical protein EG835_07930, partial [bacterium]|nr:hypothetical protein [bacterium]
MSTGREPESEAAVRFRVKLFTEAGSQRGFGHLARCVAIYDALEACGATPTLIVRGHAPGAVVEGRSAVEAEWATQEAARTLATGADAAVIDSYEAQADIYRAIALEVACVAYLDDTHRLDSPP